jgi:poly(3-hydroxybutyrate) depolymerase
VQRDQRPERDGRTARERGRRPLAAILLLATALLLAQAAGCGDDASKPQPLTLESGGVPRTAIVVPGKGDEDDPAPLIVAFHGAGSTAAELLQSITTFPERSGATVVVPDALPCGSAAGGGQCWPAEADAKGIGEEEAFVQKLVETVAARFPVNRERVYALGLSNGGAWTLRLLLDRPDLIRGGLVVAGYDPTRTYARTPDGALALPLTPVTPSAIHKPATFRPLVLEHGTADALVPYPLTLELVRTLTAEGWPGQTTLLEPTVGVGHLDPVLLLPDTLVRTFMFIDQRETAPAGTATAPSGGSG